MNLPQPIADVVDTATARVHRSDPALPRTGGPAGNAQLTAWMGLLLLVLLAAELVTLLDVSSFISWHIAIGVLLIPAALVKTATTGWRIARYYSGSRPYRTAGPPPLLLRLLGPLVVLTTLAVLGSGVALIALGRDASRVRVITVLGKDISAVTVHQACFLVFAVVTGVHILARLLPAMRLSLAAGPRGIDGAAPRVALVAVTLAVAAVGAALALALSHGWVGADHLRHDDRRSASVVVSVRS